ncbi:MAG: MBL fold metallo-hydrolase, partial [Euryarchaeota archaeon]|nr:MBL fold metallo-hydrolase [Euryarchaeota archaeon]
MNLRFLGACNEVGRSAIQVDSVLLDYGLKPANPPEYPLASDAEAAIISHAHLDHSGVLPNLMDLNPRVYMTPPTRDLAYL